MHLVNEKAMYQARVPGVGWSPFPAEMQTEKAKASFKDGILEVRIPKTEAAVQKVKKIKID